MIEILPHGVKIGLAIFKENVYNKAVKQLYKFHKASLHTDKVTR